MADLAAIAFDDEALGIQLRAELAKLQNEYMIQMENVGIVTRDAAACRTVPTGM